MRMFLALIVVLVPTLAKADWLDDANEALLELRIEDADRILTSASGDGAAYDYLLARLRHHQGRYGDAREAIERSLQAQPADGDDDPRVVLKDLVVATDEITESYQRAEAAGGRYVVLHAARDRVLVPYALEALQKADEALQAELGHRVPGPIRLEIYGSAEELARVSTLTVENIRTSGTIALCKWDRLMVTSPRALLRGYPWMDTIAHELTHMVLARATHDHAPVWVQEGIAKFLERRWRLDAADGALAPPVQALLQRAAADGELLPFERLHPSIALLPSQEQAALAFAQVSSFVALFYRTFGQDALHRVVRLLAENVDAREAFGRASGQSFAALERTWRGSLGPAPSAQAPEFMGLAFGQGDDDPLAEQAQRHLRLGDMLWRRERYGAAAREYERAMGEAPESPLLAARLARASLAWQRAGGDGSLAERAVRVLEPMAEDHPTYAPVRAYLGSAYRALGRDEDAARESQAAITLNPFDPRPHCDLAAASEGAIAQRETDACRSLGGERP